MKEYIKLYQKLREDYYQKWGAYSYPETLQDFERLNQKIFEEHLYYIQSLSSAVCTCGDEIDDVRLCDFSHLLDSFNLNHCDKLGYYTLVNLYRFRGNTFRTL